MSTNPCSLASNMHAPHSFECGTAFKNTTPWRADQSKGIFADYEFRAHVLNLEASSTFDSHNLKATFTALLVVVAQRSDGQFTNKSANFNQVYNSQTLDLIKASGTSAITSTLHLQERV